jgi:hypothetical protein
MKEVVLGWSDKSSFPVFPDACIICMKPARGQVKMDRLNLAIPYCEEHLEKARVANQFYKEFVETDGSVAKVINWISWVAAIVTFGISAKAMATGNTIDAKTTLVAILFGAIAKGIVQFGLGYLYLLLRLKPIAKKRGITFDEGSHPFLGFVWSVSSGQQGKQLTMKFDNDEYAGQVETGVKQQHVKEPA